MPVVDKHGQPLAVGDIVEVDIPHGVYGGPCEILEVLGDDGLHVLVLRHECLDGAKLPWLAREAVKSTRDQAYANKIAADLKL